jgi:hypothetical protein
MFENLNIDAVFLYAITALPSGLSAALVLFAVRAVARRCRRCDSVMPVSLDFG